MENKNKNQPIYKTIGQAAKELDLVDKRTGQLQTHTITYYPILSNTNKYYDIL